jgi:hypothetical protein
MERPFRPSRRFRRKYNRLFEEDPKAANMFLLLCELANEKGQVETDPAELAKLMAVRFEDPKEYAL